MNDREKLINILEMPIHVMCGHNSVGEKRMYNEEAEIIANRILADGWIRLPCKVGDKLGFIQKKNKRIIWGEVADITVSTNGLFAYVLERDDGDVIDEWNIPLCNLGKTVFLSPEEAEKALEGVE